MLNAYSKRGPEAGSWCTEVWDGAREERDRQPVAFLLRQAAGELKRDSEKPYMLRYVVQVFGLLYPFVEEKVTELRAGCTPMYRQYRLQGA